MAKFKLLRGIHSEGGKTYVPGDIIDSKSDLLAHNTTPNAPRFEEVRSRSKKQEAPPEDE